MKSAEGGLYRAFLVLASLVVVVAALSWAQAVLVPVALGLLLTFVLTPGVMALQRRGVPRVAAVIAVVVLAFALLGGIGLVLAYQFNSLLTELPAHQDNIARKLAALRGGTGPSPLDRFQETLDHLSPAADAADPIPVEIRAPGYGQLWAQAGPVLQALTSAGPVLEGLATAGLAVVLVIFMLVQREDLRNRLVRLIGRGSLAVTTRALDEAAQRISRSLITQLSVNAALGLALAVGLAALGVPYAFLWGALAAALRFLPYLGITLAATLPLLYSVAVSPGWLQPLAVLALFTGLEALTVYLVEPVLLGYPTGVSSVALLVAAAFWTWLWGAVGLLLATPLTTCLVVLGKYVPSLEFFSVLLGKEQVLGPHQNYYQRLLARDRDEAAALVEGLIPARPLEAIYDEVLVPALVLARRDRERGELDPEDEEYVHRATEEILDEVLETQVRLSRVARFGPEAAAPAAAERPCVLCCPAQDGADELALRMFAQLLAQRGLAAEVLSVQTLASELVIRVEKDRPAMVCVAALPPGGLVQARYLCKRLRLQFPELKIFLGRWGQSTNLDRVRDRLRDAGADAVSATLLETRDLVIPVAQTACHTLAAT